MLKKIIVTAIALAFAGQASAQVAVGGYTRSNGTYVAPHTRTAPNNSTYDNYGSSRAPSTTYRAQPLYGAPAQTQPSCSGYSCYGQPSSTTTRPRTNRVEGHTRSNGTYVQPYYRSTPR